MMSPALHTDYSGLAIERQKSLMASAQKGGTEEIRQTAEDFEAFFLSRMVETMFEGISTDGMFGGGNGENGNGTPSASLTHHPMRNRGTGGGVDSFRFRCLAMGGQQTESERLADRHPQHAGLDLADSWLR